MSKEPTGKRIETQTDAQVELQKFIQRSSNEQGLDFTQGAAEFLSKAAATSIVKSVGRKDIAAQVEGAKSSFAAVASEIGKFAGKSRVNLREAKQLRAQERFCGIRPWC